MRIVKKGADGPGGKGGPQSPVTLAITQADPARVEAQVPPARNALRDAIAISPLTGIVAKRHIQPGEKIAFDSPLVTVVARQEVAPVFLSQVADVIDGEKKETSKARC
jgi:hypothetical protein